MRNRQGRRLAETAREVAPPDLRDAVRHAVAVGVEPDPRGTRRTARVLVAACVLVVVVAVGGSLTLGRRTPGEPGPIAAALDSYHHVNGSGIERAPDLGTMGLKVMASENMSLAGMPVEAFAYRSPTGSTLTLYMADVAFPRATEATPLQLGTSQGWQAERDGMMMIGGNTPPSYLAVTSDHGLADLFSQSLSNRADRAHGLIGNQVLHPGGNRSRRLASLSIETAARRAEEEVAMRRGALGIVMVSALLFVGMNGAFAAPASHVTIAYNHMSMHFNGKVTSGNAECTAHRTVKDLQGDRQRPEAPGEGPDRFDGPVVGRSDARRPRQILRQGAEAEGDGGRVPRREIATIDVM